MDERELQRAIKEYYDESFQKELDASINKEGVYACDDRPLWWLQKLGVHSGDTYYAQFLRYLDVKPGKRLLDIACGLGGLLLLAEAKGLQTHGLDISRKGVEIARLNANASEILQGNAEALPYKDGTFHYVTCIGSLEHMLHPEVALREMRRVCVPGGKLCVVVPNAHHLGAYRNLFKRRVDYHQLTAQLYEKVDTLSGWRRLIEGNGWRIRRLHRENHTWMQKRFSLRQKVRLLLNTILPLRLSYHFVFVCEK